MRRPIVRLGLFVFALPFSLSAQHGNGSASPAAGGVGHSGPAAAPVVVRSTPAHAPSHGSVNNVKPARPHPRNPNPGPKPPVNSGTGYPVVSRDCNQHFSYPIQGLSACPAPQIPYYGATYFLAVPYYVDTSAPGQEQMQEESQDQATNDDQQSTGDVTEDSRQPADSVEDHPSTDSLSEFVFIQRDGSKFYAVAYSFLKDKIQYVTVDGVRHTLSVDALDFDATQKINEQLGNTINLPSLPPSGVALNIQPVPLR